MSKKPNPLKKIALAKKIQIPESDWIVNVARDKVLQDHNYSFEQTKENFDDLIHEIQSQVYALYLENEREYGSQVLNLLIEKIQNEGASSIEDLKGKIGKYF